MALLSSSKGKKRARESYGGVSADSPLSPVPTEHPTTVKKSKRAETRPCPVCNEAIPLRLMSRHAQLEAERVEDIIKDIGSTSSLDKLNYDEINVGSNSNARRSALKARKSFSSNVRNSNMEMEKVLHTIKRHRKRRHWKLKEMAREEEGNERRDAWMRRVVGGEISCPVCFAVIRGDQDVLDAHVDSCLADATRKVEEEALRQIARQRAQNEELWEDEVDPDGTVGYVGDIRGAGFHTLNNRDEDLDEEVDIDGDDKSVFGEAQFTEGDILPIHAAQLVMETEVEIEGDSEDEAEKEQKTLHDLVTESKTLAAAAPQIGNKLDARYMDKLELAISTAQKGGNKSAMIIALENKIRHLETTRVTLLCRICIDPYDEPTVSTGCWHTCCRECWLRCLGSTKLCPICKRITSATELRRVYL